MPGDRPQPVRGQTSSRGCSTSARPTRCSISLRSRSRTLKPTSAPSSVGSIWTRNERLPKGVLTTLTIASATAEASASGGTMAAKAFCTCSPKPAYGPASYSATRASSAGRPEWAKWLVAPVKAPGTMIEVLESPAAQFPGIDNGHRVPAGFRREIGSKIRRRAACRTAAGPPDDQTLLLPAQMGQHRPVHPLGAHYIDVVELGELLGREGFGRAEDHVSGVMDQHIDATTLPDDLADRGVNRILRKYVQLDD